MIYFPMKFSEKLYVRSHYKTFMAQLNVAKDTDKGTDLDIFPTLHISAAFNSYCCETTHFLVSPYLN